MKLKFTVITCIAFFIVADGMAQMTWAPDGATWYFDYNEICFSGYNKIEIEGDSIINGQTCKIMRPHIVGYTCTGTYSEFEHEVELTYADNDRVYHWTGENFEVLYDFLLQPNDVYVVGAYDPCAEGDTLRVTETGVMNVNGFDLRYYDVELLNNMFGEVIFGRIVERLGPIESFLFPLPRCLTDYMHSGPFRCYYDHSFDSYSSGIVEECDYLNGIEELAHQTTSCYPNPASNTITFNAQSPIQELRYYSAVGELVLQQRSSAMHVETDISFLPKGVYMVVVTTANGSIETVKWIKE